MNRKTICFLVNYLENEYQLTVMQGIADFAEEYDLNLICFEGGSIQSTFEYDNVRNALYDIANKNNIDGIIMLSSSLSHYISLDEFKKFYSKFEPLPIVSIALTLDEMPSITIDNNSGMQLLLLHLIEHHQFKKFAFIRGPLEQEDAQKRYEIFLDTMYRYNIPVDLDLIIEGDFTQKSGADAVRVLLDERNKQFDVIVAADDDMAFGAIEELNRRGIQVPYDIAVVGFNNLQISTFSSPPLTTVEQPIYQQGRQAAENLYRMMNKKNTSMQTIIPTKLVLRESCGCFSRSTIKAGLKTSQKQIRTLEDLTPASKENLQQEIFNSLKHSYLHLSEDDLYIFVIALLDSFISDIREESKNQFVKTWNDVLYYILNREGRKAHCDEIITEMRKSILPLLMMKQNIERAENMWHQARVILTEKTIQMERYHHHTERMQNRVFNEIREQLIMTFKEEDIVEILQKDIPMLSIPSCFLCLFENEGAAKEEDARLVLAFNEHGPIEIKEEESVFKMVDLLPEGMLPTDRRYSILVESLIFQQAQLGYVLFEMGPRNGYLYAELRRIITSAFKGAMLFKQIQHQTIHLTEQKENLSINIQKLRKAMGGFVQTMAQMIEERDPYTAGHQRRVSDLAQAIALEMQLPYERIEAVKMAGIIHDLGKISVPSEILNKPGRLRDIEFELIKIHPQIGYDIVKNIDFPWPIADIVLHHHESIDGSGYPKGLKGEEISLEARIIKVADVVEAITSHRPYRPALGLDVALDEITKNQGTIYDKDVVATCIHLFKEKGYVL